MNGDDFRQDVDYDLFGTLWNGLRLSMGGTSPVRGLERPSDHAIRSLSKRQSLQFGRRDGGDWNGGGDALTSVVFNASKRFFNRLQLVGRYQVVNFSGVSDQAIFDVSCDIGHEQAVYGRLAAQDGEIGGYLAYRRSGNLGAEYFLIVGDPNATTFRQRDLEGRVSAADRQQQASLG